MTKNDLIPVEQETVEDIHSRKVDDGLEGGLNLRHTFNVWMRRRWLIIGFIILGAVCAVLFILFTKPVYEATTTIELNKAGSGSAGLDFDSMGSLGIGGGNLQTDLMTEAGVLKSHALALAVIEKLNLASQPPFVNSKKPVKDVRDVSNLSPSERTRLIEIFQSRLKVASIPDTRLIRVSFRSHDPKQAAAVANAIISSYKEMYFQTHYAAVSEATNWMTEQLSGLKANVENSEKQLSDFEKANDILTVPAGTSASAGGMMDGQIHSPVIQRLDELNTELTAAETDRIQKEAVYRLAEGGNPDVILGLKTSPVAQGSSLVAVAGGQQDLDTLQNLESKRSDLLVTIAQGKAIYGPNNRHLKDLQMQLDGINSQLQGAMRKIADRAAADLKVAQQTEDAIRSRFNATEVDAGKLNEKNVQLAILSQEAFSQKTLYEDLYTKLQEADVSAGMKATNITIVDSANVPSNPVLPKRKLVLLLGLVFGALIGFGTAHLMDAIDITVISLPDIEQITGSPVLAVIPDFKRAPSGNKSRGEKNSQSNELEPRRPSPWILAHPTSTAAEAFRALRTSVLLSRPGGALKTLLITSSVPAEGKSTVSLNLAVAIAQSGKKVIIVEADMRRPTMKQHLGEGSDIGLSSVLTDLVSLDRAIVCGVGTPNLDVLPAGPVPPLPAELLGSVKFDELLAELRSRYEVVLIDSPPALILADALAIGSKSDALVWVVRAGKATRPHLVRAAQQIHRNRLPLIGYVLNGLDRRVDPYGYGYSYYGYNSKQYGAYYGEENNRDA